MTSYVTSRPESVPLEADADEKGLAHLPPRRRARMVAVQVLYEVDATGHQPEACAAWSLPEAPLRGDGRSFAQELVAGVLDHRQALDERIQAQAPAWPVDQLAGVDRNLLRLAIYEIVIDRRVPPKVAINESVELAKLLGSESSSRFVNGVLGAIMEHAHR